MRRREKRKFAWIIKLLIILFCLLMFSTIFALITSMNSNIISNVKINNIQVSGLDRMQTEKKFESIINKIMDEEITLKHGENEKKFTLKQMELETNINDKIYEACTIGRSSNIFENNFKVVQTMINGENLDIDFKYNEEIMQSIFSNLDTEWEGKFVDNTYYIDGENLVIVRGKKGIVLDEEGIRNAIDKLARDKIEGKEINEIDIPIMEKEPESIDIEKIEKDIFKEPKNASYDKARGELTIHSNGIELGIELEEAKKIVQEEKEEYIIPLQITMPQVTTDMLGEDAFPNVLGKFSTRYDASNKNRATNIELASEAINGKVFAPGERFSFNSVVGPTPASKGYLPAGAYSAGELVQSYGGGVCQVSSTLYNAVLLSNLKIVERYNHSSVVSYVDPGRDATISYGSRDFKFENSRKYGIKIMAKASNGILDMEIRGIFEDEEYEVEISSKKTDTVPCKTKYVYDSTLGENEEVVESGGANGAKSIAYITKKKNGKEISKEVLSEDSYNPMSKIVKTGNRSKAGKEL